MTKKHVIVGGLGNLGRHLQRTLLEQGKSVTVIDRPLQQEPPLEHSSVTYVPFVLGEGDVRNLQSKAEALQSALQGADTVYSIVTPDVARGTRSEFQRVNRWGVQELIHACHVAQVPKLVYGSSIAVMNHFEPHHNANETHPLPALDSYVSYYDLTKRLGEDAVLKAHNTTSSRPSASTPVLLKTCALRFGGILAGPRDYYFRDMFPSYRKSGVVHTNAIYPSLDVISAVDCSRALAAASEQLEEEEAMDPYESTLLLSGKAVFCTKDKSQIAPTTTQVMEYAVERINTINNNNDDSKCKVQYIPPGVYQLIRGGFWAYHYGVQQWTTKADDLPGIPMYRYMQIPLVEQTFDNALALEALKGWTPQLSWQDAIDQIVQEEEEQYQASIKVQV